VVFTLASVFIFQVPFHGDIAEDNGDVLTRCANLLAPIFAFAQKCAALPFVSQEITRHAHFRKQQKLDLIALGAFDMREHLPAVVGRLAGYDIKLNEAYFHVSSSLKMQTGADAPVPGLRGAQYTSLPI